MAFSYCHWATATATGQFSRPGLPDAISPRGPSNTKLHARGTGTQKTRRGKSKCGCEWAECVGSFALWFCFVHWNLCSNFMKRTCFPAASLRLLGPKNTLVLVCVCEWDWKSLGLLNINSKRLQGSEFLGPDFSWWFRLLLPLAFYFCGEGGFLENYKITIISMLIYDESFLSWFIRYAAGNSEISFPCSVRGFLLFLQRNFECLPFDSRVKNSTVDP